MRQLVGLIAIIGIVIGCTSSEQNSVRDWMHPNGKLKVLCTTAMIGNVVSQIGGDYVDCLTLIQGESDPHSYQLVKGDDEKFSRADLIFYSGLGLEHGPSLRTVLEGNSKAVAVGEYIQRKRPQDIVWVGKTVDPHIWMDVSLWKEGVPCIADQLSKVLSSEKDKIHERAVTVFSDLEKLHERIKTDLHQIPEQFRYLVTTHNAFSYFTRAYLAEPDELSSDAWRKRCAAPEGLSPESQLSTADIQRLVAHMERYNISVVFIEANVNYDSLKKVADVMKKNGRPIRIASKPLYADSLGSFTYHSMMEYDAGVLRENMGDEHAP